MGRIATWKPVGFFVLRAPLLAFDEREAWAGGDATGTTNQWRAMARRADVREALFLASPSLEKQLAPWLAGDPGADLGRAGRPLGAYLSRLTTRPTPFGLFAGCAAGQLGDSTTLIVSDDIRRRTRPDMDYLVALASRLEALADIRATLRWQPNSSLYPTAGRLRLVETRIDGSARSHHLVALDVDDALMTTLERAQGGAPMEELVEALVSDDITTGEAAAYVGELIDAQVLESGLAPPVTGPEPLGVLIAALRSIGGANLVGTMLGLCADTLAKIDAGGAGADPSAYRDLGRQLLAFVPDADPAHLFQVDLFRAGAGLMLGPRVVAEATRAVDLLNRLAPPEPDPLAGFRDAFWARYEDREIPLVEALDEEAGIGFDPSTHPAADESPLLAGLMLGTEREDERVATGRDQVLLRLIDGAIRQQCLEVELDDATIGRLSTPTPPESPPTASLLGRLAATSWEAVDRGQFSLLVHSVQGSSGAQLLGRFCHGDAAIEEGVRRMLAIEEASQPEAVFAEVVHLPEGRMGNILCRPVLRDYEIVFLGRSCAPPDRQLPVTDLLVSIRGGRIVLRSARLGRQVIPRLTSAHNTARRSIGIYRFLASLQSQGRWAGLSWSWGASTGAPFLPRVRVGRLVLARACWSLDRQQIALFTAERDGVTDWRRRFAVPRWVALADGDNELVLDLDSPLSVELFTQSLPGRGEAQVVELFPPPDQLCATGTGGRYVHEFVLPLQRVAPAPPVAPTPPTAPAARPEPAIDRSFPRRFAPGSEWLYFKLYTGTATADDVLCDVVGPLVRAAVDSGAADRWFFLRYRDPDHHVRVRLHGDPMRLRAEVEPLLDTCLRQAWADGRIWRLSYDTYEREVERYGGPGGMERCEAIFRADSDAALGILERLEGDAGLDARWRLVLAGTDRLLRDFGFDLAARRRWVRARRAAYLTEFPGGQMLEKQLAQRWRDEAATLGPLLDWTGDPEHPLAPGLELLAARSDAITPIASELRADARELTLPIDDIVASLAHLHAIRLLRSEARAQELVVHHLLDRHYHARLARQGRP